MKPKKTPAKGSLKRVVWYARAGHIARMGPFDTQIEAVAATRLSREEPWSIWVQANLVTGEFFNNTFVWPEELDEARGSKSGSAAKRTRAAAKR